MNHIKKYNHWYTLLALLLALGGGGYSVARHVPVDRPSPSVSLPAESDINAPGTGCNKDFEAHTYHPSRLVRLQDCVAVSGTVIKIKPEADGDDHVQFQLDPQYVSLMNSMNADTTNAITGGYFIIEPQCVGVVTQADAIAACSGAVPPPGFSKLRVGAHLTITGPWVNDSQHGHNEIHPVEAIQ